MTMSKYHSKKVVTDDGITFDSRKEANRWWQLKLMERAGQICNLKRQVKRELIPSQYIDGKCVERAVTYTSDFEYDMLVPPRQKTVMVEKEAKQMVHVVEDVKGVRTQEYILKRKLMFYIHRIRIKEI